LSNLDAHELTIHTPLLYAWELGAVDNMDAVARYLVRGGPKLQASARRRPPGMMEYNALEDDPRPDKKYWEMVKEELTAFLCTNDKRYKELWIRIRALESKSTSAIVLLVSGYLGEKFGLQASLIAGFVAVVFYGVLKVGTEAYCRLALSPK
jgi:hypothetical protein